MGATFRPRTAYAHMSSHLSARLRLLSLAATAAALILFPGSATARTYTVVSCNSAVSYGSNASAWERYSNAGSTYETCPSNGGFTAGVSNRMTGQSFSGFNFSGHAFNAPPGTTITSVRWGGRVARGACYWGTYMRAMPSARTVLGFANGEHCSQTDFDITNYPITYGVPAGTTRLEQLVFCGAATCDAGAAMHSHVLEVTIDDPQPPSISLSGRMVSGEWVSGTAGNPPGLDLTASDSSGIQTIEASLELQRPTESFQCNWSHPSPCPVQASMGSVPSVAELSDGRHALRVSATDAAGNWASVAKDVWVDNTPPDPVAPEIAGGSGWRRTNSFDAVWADQPIVAAPITTVHWKLCLADGTCPTRGERAVGNSPELSDIRLPAPGDYRLHIWLEDAAGNQREANSAISVPVRFDPEPPILSFAPTDASDPLKVAVNASDGLSGVAGGEIEMRAAGGNTWHGMATVREGSQLVAYVDDERFRTGLYEFRAHAQDQAGNEASTATRVDGATASLRLPARISTRLRVGHRSQRPHRKVRLDTRIAASLDSTVRLTGRLTNTDGQPIDAGSIEALERRPDGTTPTIGLATTSRRGTFRYLLRATHNRDVVFRYGGSRRIGAASTVVHVRVPGATSIKASHRVVRNGDSVLFVGQVRTQPLPPAGKLLEMQAFFRGRWRTFSTLRTTTLGRWRFRYRFGATLGRVTYRFRARLPTEGGYPFIGGESRVVRVVVLGA